jgi:Peptidase family M28
MEHSSHGDGTRMTCTDTLRGRPSAARPAPGANPQRRATLALVLSACIAAACAHPRTAPVAPAAATASRTRALLSALADDSMEGRGTGTPGSMRAARFIAARMRQAGLEPVGDSGYFQRVPMALVTNARTGRTRPTMFPSFDALDTVPASRRLTGGNVVGILPGSDPSLSGEVILVDAHYDHLGIGQPVNGDSIYNGADDDASGTVTVLEVARLMAGGPRPRRTIVFLTTTGEEVGLLGTNWFASHPVGSLDRYVANLEIEMIGRPDSLAGGPGRGWLTGYERSTMGDEFAAAGLPIEPDKRPNERFFSRSDNIGFARRGIVAQTLSSFNLHREYHTPADEVGLVDFDHMAALINVAARAVRILADGPRVEWKEGGKP